MKTFILNITKTNPWNDRPMYEVEFKNVSARGTTPTKAMQALKDAIKRTQFEASINFEFYITLADNQSEVELIMPKDKVFYLS